ncbi:MAG: alpha/beta hydrolase [Anaerolineales bacterium]|nr:alpha/beta hydrolase [Anaerolineales bacterium]
MSEIGSGQPILIVPGNNGDAFPLIPLMAELQGMRILALNRPGGGLSDGMDHRKVDFRSFAVETLASVLDAFGLKDIPMIAHSIGGQWSLWLALDRPEYVSKLVLLGVPGNLLSTSPPLALRLTTIPVLNQFVYDLVMPSSPEDALRGLAFMGHGEETLGQLSNAMKECFYYFQKLPNAKVSSLSLMRKVNRLRGSRPEIRLDTAALQRVQQPTMFLWGSNDPFGSIAVGRGIADLLPDARFHGVEGGGHLPWLDAPVACGQWARAFILGDG